MQWPHAPPLSAARIKTPRLPCTSTRVSLNFGIFHHMARRRHTGPKRSDMRRTLLIARSLKTVLLIWVVRPVGDQYVDQHSRHKLCTSLSHQNIHQKHVNLANVGQYINPRLCPRDSNNTHFSRNPWKLGMARTLSLLPLCLYYSARCLAITAKITV